MVLSRIVVFQNWRWPFDVIPGNIEHAHQINFVYNIRIKSLFYPCFETLLKAHKSFVADICKNKWNKLVTFVIQHGSIVVIKKLFRKFAICIFWIIPLHLDTSIISSPTCFGVARTNFGTHVLVK